MNFLISIFIESSQASAGKTLPSLSEYSYDNNERQCSNTHQGQYLPVAEISNAELRTKLSNMGKGKFHLKLKHIRLKFRTV